MRRRIVVDTEFTVADADDTAERGLRGAGPNRDRQRHRVFSG
jgi:hypothetical protein